MAPEITGQAVGNNVEALAVSPRQACRLLGIGNTRLYQLLAAGELEAYHEGRARRITTRSIYRRVERLLAESGATSGDAKVAPARRRGRMLKQRERKGSAP